MGRVDQDEQTRPRGWLVLDALACIALGGVATFIATWRTSATTLYAAEVEAYLITGAICESGGGCPLHGPPWGGADVFLGPLYFMLLSALQWVSTHPLAPYYTFIALWGVAVALASWLGGRVLGGPFGLFVGAFMCLDDSAVSVMAMARHAAWIFLPMTALYAFTRTWLRGGGTRPFAGAVIMLAIASQLHALSMFVVPFFVALALWLRPPLRARGVVGAALVVLGLYLPLLWHIALEGVTLGSAAALATGAAGTPAVWSLPQLTRTPLPLLLFGGCAVLLRAWRVREERPDLLPALVCVGAIGFAAVFAGGWQPRYNFLFQPAGGLVAAGALAITWRALLNAVRPRDATPRQRAWSAAVLIAGLVCISFSVQGLLRAAERTLRPMTVHGWLPVDVQLGTGRAVRSHGLGRDAFDFRIHGEMIHREGMGTAFIAHHLQLPRRGADSDMDLLLLGACPNLDSGFAQWQETVQGAGQIFVLLGYRRGISVEAELPAPQGDWRAPLLLPLDGYEHHILLRRHSVAQTHDLYAMPLQRPGDLWSAELGNLVLHVHVDPRDVDRALVIEHTRDVVAQVQFHGLQPLGTRSFERTHKLHHRFRIPAGATLDVGTVEIAWRPPHDGTFRLDIYEEPLPGCPTGTSVSETTRSFPVRLAW